MMKKYKILAFTLCAAVMLSGCTENKTTPAASEAPETSAPVVTTVSTAETTQSETTADTTTATESESSENSGEPETTVSETTTTETTTEKAAEKTTEATANKSRSPDENMFTLYMGGNEKCEKYDVKVKAVLEKAIDEIVLKLKAGTDDGVLLTKDNNGKYIISSADTYKNRASLGFIEEMLKKETYKELINNTNEPEYANMTYEEYVDYIFDNFGSLYPGLKDMFDENYKLKQGADDKDFLFVRCYIQNDFKSSYCDDETVIKEGLNCIFDILENNKDYQKYEKTVQSGDTLWREAFISYNGGYCLTAGVSATAKNAGNWQYGDMIWLGKAKVYEKDPKHLTRQIIPADYPILKSLNTADSPYEMSLEIISEGFRGEGIKVSESEYSNAMRNDAILGEIPEISFIDLGDEYGFDFGDVKEIYIKFKIKEPYRSNVIGTYAEKQPELKGIKRLNVFMYFEDTNTTLPIETYFDEDENIVYTVTDTAGTYCLYDMEKWLQMLDIEP